MKSALYVTLCLLGVLLLDVSIWSHSGGLDANGGHYNRKTGEYHVHRPQTRQSQDAKPTPKPQTDGPVPAREQALAEGAAAQQRSVAAVEYPAPDFADAIAYRVIRVIDGDTIEIDMNGTLEKVRLIGVDTPETVDPRKRVQAFGKEASAFTRNLLIGEDVFLRSGSESRDRYGRLLAYVFRAPDGMFVNLEIVRQG